MPSSRPRPYLALDPAYKHGFCKAEAMELVPAAAFDLPTLTGLFNAGFSGYPFPMELSEEAFADHVAFYDLDLDISRVVVDDGPVAFAHVGRRQNTGWIGGMGTTPPHRRRGLGEKVLVAAIEAAVAGGCTEVGLEVLVDNEPAIRLYTKLGFDLVRDLAVWSLPPTGRQPTAAADVLEIGSAQEWIAAHRNGPEPWQRADDTIAALQRRGVRLRGLVSKRGDDLVAVAIIREQGETVAVLQIAALDEDSASNMLLVAAEGRTLRLANLPIDEAASRAIRRLGGDRVAVQHELVLRA
jgi:ribosomal protein S18 acetylase RimI-like enzyme